VNLSVDQGQFCSIIGPNGAGKSTLCAAIRGFVPKFYKGEMRGSVAIHGRDIHDMTIGDLAEDVGFVFQNPFTQMSGITETVYDELAFGLGNLGVTPSVIRDKVEEMMELAKITSFRDRNPFHLSGGQQQRVALAAMLIMDQDVLVIDEPTSQLDPQSTDDVFELIGRAKSAGRTIVLVEHKMNHIAAYSDKVVLLDEGGIILEGTPAEVFSDERTPAHGVQLPEAVSLSAALRDRGVDVAGVPLTIQDLARNLTTTGGE
jgi:energy-coupling factor transport system ATP-binding protein